MNFILVTICLASVQGSYWYPKDNSKHSGEELSVSDIHGEIEELSDEIRSVRRWLGDDNMKILNDMENRLTSVTNRQYSFMENVYKRLQLLEERMIQLEGARKREF